nr:hypothetical protein [Streptomyces adelaidensis]
MAEAVAQADGFRRTGDRLRDAPTWHLAQPGRVGQELADRAAAEHAEFLRETAETAPDFETLRRDAGVAVQEAHRALGGGGRGGEDPEESGLSGAVGAEDGVDAHAGGEGEGQIVEDQGAAAYGETVGVSHRGPGVGGGAEGVVAEVEEFYEYGGADGPDPGAGGGSVQDRHPGNVVMRRRWPSVDRAVRSSGTGVCAGGAGTARAPVRPGARAAPGLSP